VKISTKSEAATSKSTYLPKQRYSHLIATARQTITTPQLLVPAHKDLVCLPLFFTSSLTDDASW
jgi:hypothetical protein